jgi:myo-inositol 2-dehydrogenase/D-chiro-inositol 1-dehydrogenase
MRSMRPAGWVRCEAGSARIGDEHAMRVTARGTEAREVPQDYLVRFADAYDREVQGWVDATRQGRSPVRAPGTATRHPSSPRPG